MPPPAELARMHTARHMLSSSVSRYVTRLDHRRASCEMWWFHERETRQSGAASRCERYDRTLLKTSAGKGGSGGVTLALGDMGGASDGIWAGEIVAGLLSVDAAAETSVNGGESGSASCRTGCLLVPSCTTG